MFNRRGFLTSTGTWKESTSGRKFMRHPSLPGTIMKWNDNGTERQTLILDADYRIASCGYNNVNTNLGLDTHQGGGGDSISKLDSDSILNANSYSNQDQMDSKRRTDEWADTTYYSSNMAAVWYVRNLLTDTIEYPSLRGIAYDVPTLNCLARIYADSAILDELDPTAAESDYNLTDWTFNCESYGSNALSSSWYGYLISDTYGVNAISSNGGFYHMTQHMPKGLIPVLEL